MLIRRFNIGEETKLFEVFYSAVHLVASRDYTQEQINAWAPENIDQAIWANRIREIKPFVVEINGNIVGYADVQSTGYIDQFFVSGYYQMMGIGTLLMSAIHKEALSKGLFELTSNVSRTAQPFFEKFGFCVIEQRRPVLRGVVLQNAFMRKTIP